MPIDYTGIFLYFFYPGAFVSFSDLHFNKCLFREKLRILCAGVWHNVVIFLFGMFILNSGIVTLSMSLTGYRSVEGTGVSVISVEVRKIIIIQRFVYLILFSLMFKKNIYVYKYSC